MHLLRHKLIIAVGLGVPAIAQAEGGYTGLLTLVVGIPLMLLGNVLLAITCALRRRRWARICAGLLLAGVVVLGIITASDASELLRRGNEDVAIGAVFFVLWLLAAVLAVAGLRGAGSVPRPAGPRHGV